MRVIRALIFLLIALPCLSQTFQQLNAEHICTVGLTACTGGVFPGNVTAHRGLIVHTAWDDSGGAKTMSMSGVCNASWHNVGTKTLGTGTLATIYGQTAYCDDATGGATTAPTVNISGAGADSFIDIIAKEVSCTGGTCASILSVGASFPEQASGSSTIIVTTGITSTHTAFIEGAIYVTDDFATGAAGSFTYRGDNPCQNSPCTEDLNGAAGSYKATFTIASGTVQALMNTIEFYESAGGGSATPAKRRPISFQ